MLHGRGWRWEPLSDGGLIGRATGWAKRHHGVASALQCGVEKILFCSEMLYSYRILDVEEIFTSQHTSKGGKMSFRIILEPLKGSR